MAKSSDIIKIGFDYRASLEQFEKETNGVFDGISEKAGKQKISIQLDAKNDKVIEKIKELQKLKLDKFTFEFGESGLAEQLKTFDQLEKKITEIINLSKGLGNITSKANGKQAIQSELDLYHMTEKRKVSYDEIIDKIQTIIKLQEKSKSLEGKKSSDGKYYQELFDEYVNWSDKDNTLNNITDRLKEIYSKFNGKITLIDESHIKEVAYLLDMVKGAGESLSGLNSKEKTFFNNKRFSNESLFNFTNSDGLLNEQIEVAEKELSSLYEWFNKFEGVSLSDSIGMEISRLTRDIQAGGKEASEYAEQLLKIFNIKLSDTTTVATPFKEEIDNANKLKEIANKTTITFEDFKTIIANLPSDKIEQLNKMLNRTLELTSDTGTSLEVMTSELGKYFTITGTRSSTSFFLSNEGEFTRKPNKNKTNFVDDEIYTKGMKYDPSDLADFAWKLQKQEQQALATAQAEEKLAETEKNLGKSTSTVDDSKFDELKADVTEIREELNGVKEKISAIDSEGFEHVKADVEKTVESVKELNNELTEMKSKLDSTSTSPVETNISSPIKDTFQGDAKSSAESSAPVVKEEAKAMEQVAENAEKASKGKDKFAKANKKVKESADSSSKAVSEEASEFNKIISKLDGYNTKLAKFEVKPADGNRFPVYQENITNLSQKIERLQELSTKDINLIDTNDVKEAKALQKEIDELIFKMSNMSAGEKGFDPLSLDKAVQKMNGELEKASGMSKKAKLEIKALISELESGNPTRATKEILHDFYKIIRAEQEAGRYGKAFMDIFKDKVIYGAAANLAGMIGIYDIINVGRQAVDIVIDLNTQITELAKVSEDSMSQIYDDFNSYAEIAKDIGGTISDTISATSDWSRNGYSIPDSKELAKVALLYKNVGDGIDIDTANESLISTLRGFEMEAKDALDIINIFNEVSNNEAISSAGIGEALQRSAASFNAANTSLQESVALISATNSVVQNPERVGNMWKVVSMRIRSASSELEQAGEDTDGLVETTADLQKMIKAMTGYDILEADGETFKSIYDIVLNISKVWHELSDLEQSSLLQALAGKQQSNALAAALSNADILEKSYKEAMNAEGSALEEQAKYQESVQYSIDRTKASLEELANDFLSSDFLKGLIDSGDKLINILDWIIDKFGVLGTLTAVGGGILGANGIG